MFKKENILNELAEIMQDKLAHQFSFEKNNKADRLEKANNYIIEASNILNKLSVNASSINNLNHSIDLLHSAIEIYDDYGLTKEADQILFLLEKIGKKHHKNISDKEIVENYESTGTAFDYDVDDNKLDIEDSDNTFEDEP